MTGEPQVRRATEEGSDVAQAYDRWSRRYDDDHNATRDLDARVVRRSPLHVAGSKVLELGCGTGKNSEWLAAQARELVALDFSPGCSTSRGGACARRTCDSSSTTSRDPGRSSASSIDVVVGNLVLEHVRDLGPIYSEAARVLRPGGELFLCELHPYRQLRGGQAHFEDAETNETIPVTAYQHSVSEYVNGGLAAGFTLRALGEHVEESAPADAVPRLLSVLFERL